MQAKQMENTFFAYQQRRLSLLLIWGLGSVLAGTLLQIKAGPFQRQWGLQALTWGAIDALLGGIGIRSARRNAERYAQGEIGETEVRKEQRSFLRILLINAGLDVGYVTAGAWVIAKMGKREDRRGLGLGILVQGLFLLLFDGYLSWEVSRASKDS